MKTEKIYRRISRTAYQRNLPSYCSGTLYNGYVYVCDGDRYFKLRIDHLPQNVYTSGSSDMLESTINNNYNCKTKGTIELPDINTVRNIIDGKELKRENRYHLKVGKKYIDIFYLLDALEAISNPICKEAVSYLRIENEDNEVCIIKE